MRPALLLVPAVLALATGCGTTDPGAAEADSPARTVTIRALCPGLHQVIDALVVSSPDSQREFRAEVQRFFDAATDDARSAMSDLVTAADALVAAGTGPAFYDARDGIHDAVVAVDGPCSEAGSPILHAGPH